MLQDNPLLAQLKAQLRQNSPSPEPLVEEAPLEGVVRAHPKGFGFLDVDYTTNYYIPPQWMKNLFDGDTVTGHIEHKGERDIFIPETLISSKLDYFLGTIVLKEDRFLIQPELADIPLLDIDLNSITVQEGDWVAAEMVQHPFRDKKTQIQLKQLIASADAPDRLWHTSLARQHHPSANVAMLDDASELIDLDADLRIDRTDIPLFTIDSESTEDMDDAIAISKNANGDFELTVAIADPTSFIAPDSALDRFARSRCFSAYLPEFTVDMLPTRFATEICSLRPNEPRHALLIQFTVSANGDMVLDSIQFTIATVCSRAKLSYQGVTDFIEQKASGADHVPSELQEAIITLSEFAKARFAWRQKEALVFEQNREYQFKLNDDFQLLAIEKRELLHANMMVEESMLAANLALTHRLFQIGFGIFNCHPGFDERHLPNAVELINKYDPEADLDKESVASFRGYLTARRLGQRDPVINYRLQRMQAPAQFSTQAHPHFSLGFAAYATGSSPIRKYNDLINHRILKADLRQAPLPSLDDSLLDDLNDTRRGLRVAERHVTQYLYSEWAKTAIDQTFTGQLMDINRGGIRLSLIENGASVFIPFSLLTQNRTLLDVQQNEGLIKFSGKTLFKLLDLIEVKIKEIKENGSLVAIPATEITA